jgi:hypothetical protein
MQQRVLGPQHHLRTFLLSGRCPEACDARSPWPVYLRSPCTCFSRCRSGSTSPLVQGCARVSTDLKASETPSSSARRITLPGLVRSIVASFSIPMRLIGCSKISASSDGVKFFLCMVVATSMRHLKNARCGKRVPAALLSKRTLLPGYLT